MRLLLVDDEGSLLLTLAANLELEGFEVVGVQSAAKALEAARESAFDLVLTDIRMPGMSGVDLFRALRREGHETPVVLMTAFALESLVEDAIQEGVFAVLPKPFAIEHVVAVLGLALRRPAVLIVDDVDDDTERAIRALSAAGLRARAALDPETAVEAVALRSADVCVVNVATPQMAGPDLMARLRKLDPSVTLIAMSARDVPELARKLSALGAFAFVPKPIRPKELVRLVAHARSSRYASPAAGSS